MTKMVTNDNMKLPFKIREDVERNISEERDLLVLSMIDANTKYQERQLKILRNIHKRVTEDTDSVVRCNNCKHTETDNTEDQAIYCKKWDRWEMPKDFFCGYGERKNAEKDI